MFVEFEALVPVHCCRILSQEFPSDITIQVGEATFNLHKVNLNHSASVSVLGWDLITEEGFGPES